MFKCLSCIDWKDVGKFASGVAFGTVGIKLLTSKDAKKVYTHGTAAVLRAKDYVLETTTKVQENMEDILADAVEINDMRMEEEFYYDDDYDDDVEFYVEDDEDSDED